MNLVRRARYCAPIAERKPEAAEVGRHPDFYDISSCNPGATAYGPGGSLPPENIPDIKTFESNVLPVASYMCSLERLIMKSKFQLVLASLVVALTALVPSAAHASTPGVARTRAHMFHNRTPRVHFHGSHHI
jgi:hypothetical protein